ncbi:MAG: adenylosuccinate lyase [Candidatus Aenigmatarchaeota archaeon]|nr:MAG: adenylosuccinate lyase [Candidatus Aenigmarchaeota archaeon]
MHSLEMLDPLDGRYADKPTVAKVRNIFSEKGLQSYRTRVEAEYLIRLSEHPQTDLREFSPEECERLMSLAELSLDDSRRIKELEAVSDHDVKAVETFMRERLKKTSLADVTSWLHFGLTSEDVNNTSYALMVGDALEKAIIPAAHNVLKETESFAVRYADLPMLARTHGQPASPTTVGKEFNVFARRMESELKQLEETRLSVKLNGATGGYDAHVAAYPNVDWMGFTRNFVDELGTGKKIKFVPNYVTTQIEPHDNLAGVFDNVARLNRVGINYAQDMWRYISDHWVGLKSKEGETGSSTMPHKVNPIRFERAEGAFTASNWILKGLSEKLQISRLQRDLSDSVTMRFAGPALGATGLGWDSMLEGLGKITINEPKILAELDAHPEVVTEALQTILRREGRDDAYDLLKGMSRGKEITAVDIHNFIEGLDISKEAKAKMHAITPRNYTGLAAKLAKYQC